KRIECMIDKIDLKIMYLLGREGRIANIDIAKQLGIPNSTVRQRLKRLAEMGVINFSCEITPKKFKEIIIVFCGIVINANRENILNELDKFPHTLFSVGITGRYDFLVVFAAESTEKINTILGKINYIHGVVHTESFIVLENNGMFIRSDKFSQIFQEELIARGEIEDN
ncbi:MAG: Lrp/AsnC family transcriptional regulator, partial [Candidatus Latescibacteria bacterium]|nr:Lrp/AsnC family transcriptional regulator [Candidatus Latescibacterota bacterium]